VGTSPAIPHLRSRSRPAVIAGFLIACLLAAGSPAAAQNCLEDRVGASLRPLNCTANDVRGASLLVVEGPGACVAGEPIDVTLKVGVIARAVERYDIGLFIALDGGNALTGQCLQDYLPPPLQPAPPACTGTPNPDGGPYFNAECDEDPTDTCGDLNHDAITYRGLPTLTLLCQDTDGDDVVDVGTCVTWDNAKSAGTANKPSCLGPDQTLPNTKSKCRCEALPVGEIEYRGGIKVIKVTDPPDDPSEFDFTLAGGPDSIDVPFIQSATLPPWLSPPLKPGTYTLNEAVVGTGWQFSHLECRNADDVVKPVTVDYGSGDVTGIEIGRGEVVTCTFTNTKQATLIVKKVMVGGEASFAFTGSGPSGTISTSGGTLQLQVPPGQYTSTEGVLPAQWRLQGIACDDDDSTGNGSVATFNAAAGEVVTCTFTNIAPGIIRIRKVTVGGDGAFGFHPSEGADFTLSNGGETTLGPLPPVAQWITELVPDGWDLTTITCDDPSGVGNLAEHRAEVQLPPGKIVTCTFTNTAGP
jgi:hypothetical protein